MAFTASNCSCPCVFAGAPLYFIVKEGLDYSEHEQQNFVCGSAGCPPDSLTGQIYQASLQANGSVALAHCSATVTLAHASQSLVDSNPAHHLTRYGYPYITTY